MNLDCSSNFVYLVISNTDPMGYLSRETRNLGDKLYRPIWKTKPDYVFTSREDLEKFLLRVDFSATPSAEIIVFEAKIYNTESVARRVKSLKIQEEIKLEKEKQKKTKARLLEKYKNETL